MKKHLTTLLSEIRSEQLEKLTTMVNETLAVEFEFSQPKSKTFSTADLWNIQRQGRSRIQRRFVH